MLKCRVLKGAVAHHLASDVLWPTAWERRLFRNSTPGSFLRSCAAPGLIAEGFGRFGDREFRRYLTTARAEVLEVQNSLTDLERRQLVSDEALNRLNRQATHAVRVMARLRSSLE